MFHILGGSLEFSVVVVYRTRKHSRHDLGLLSGSYVLGPALNHS